MKQFKIIFLMTAASMLLYGCPSTDDEHRYIIFVNNSDKEIGCQEFWSESITSADTLIRCKTGIHGILPNSVHEFKSLSNSGWESDFKTIPYIQYSVVDIEAYDNYISAPCDTIRKYVPILHIYKLTLEDLQRMNWTVVYPPSKK